MDKIRVTVSFEINDDFYTGERLSKKEKDRHYEEDFADIEVLWNHIPKTGYNLEIKRIKE